jgi:hypothetical protein
MVKIEFVKGESFGIYYTEDLLLHLLGISKNEEDQILFILGQFAKENEPEYGELQYQTANGRYKLTMPAKGMEYVKEKYQNNHFLEDLIGTLKELDTSIDTIMKVFLKYSNDVICRKANDDEFDYTVRFSDSEIDPFIYCFTFNEMGQYYHRFTEYDYKNLV